MKRLIMIGASGHGKVCADIAEQMGVWDEIVFADDHPPAPYPYRIIGTTDDVADGDADFFVAIGDAQIREKITGRLKKSVTLIHPRAVIGGDVAIGNGCVVMAGAVINSGTTIGDGVIINTCSSVDHDCKLDDYVHVAVGAHLCGMVRIGKSTWIGAGSTVKNNISICGGCMIGAGAVVVQNIAEGGTYMGVPAKKRK